MPRILFLSTRFPLPLDTGGKIRTANILRQLREYFEVTVISNVHRPKDEPLLPLMENYANRFIEVPWREVPKYSLAYYWKIFKHSFSPLPVTVMNDYSRDMEQAVRKELEARSYDLIICDFVQSAVNMAEIGDSVPILLFQHNVEATILERHFRNSKNPLMRYFWWRQFRKMHEFEERECRRCSQVIAVSDIDRDRMREDYGVEHVASIPTGVDTEYFAPRDANPKQQLVFVGSMDWEPNDDAMTYFIESIYPLVRERLPDMDLVVVGRNPSPRLKALAGRSTGVTLTGRVDDTRSFIAESTVFVVPIRIGGGTRIKIYEAMAMEKAVVSTTVGAEGLPLTDGEHILFADDAARFADCVIRLSENQAERETMEQRGRAYVLEHFGWRKVGKIFADICQDTLARSSKTPTAP